MLRCLDAWILGCWGAWLLGCLDSIYTLEIVNHFSEGVNRDRLCGRSALKCWLPQGSVLLFNRLPHSTTDTFHLRLPPNQVGGRPTSIEFESGWEIVSRVLSLRWRGAKYSQEKSEPPLPH